MYAQKMGVAWHLWMMAVVRVGISRHDNAFERDMCRQGMLRIFFDVCIELQVHSGTCLLPLGHVVAPACCIVVDFQMPTCASIPSKPMLSIPGVVIVAADPTPSHFDTKWMMCRLHHLKSCQAPAACSARIVS